ncbi:hypothetical protein BGZ58_006378 [Dissophora ornata]|nr:hypothetical protein BGZ58_006378 [Dissophora ornata]
MTADADADKLRWGISVLLFQHIAPEHQWISKFILDCFEGQFIGSVVLVVFVAVFLLREWVLQNQEGEAARMAIDDVIAPMVGAEVEAPGFNMEHAVERFIAAQHHIEAVVEGDADLSDDSDGSDSGSDSDDEGAQVEQPQQPVEGLAPVIDAREARRQEMIRQINERGMRLRLQHAAGNQLEQNPLQEDIPARQFPPAPPAAPVNPPPPPRPPAPPAPAVADQDDELEDLNVEELDGVLEVIGMHGSFWLLLQNSLLIAALICATLGLGVWIPFMIGKTILLMSPFNILRLPHAFLSRLTDPIMDYIFDRVLPYAGAALSKAITTINSQPLEMLYQNHILPTWNAVIEIGASGIVQDISPKDSAISVGTETLIPGQPALNDTNTIIMHHVAQKWTELAYGTSSGDKFAAITIGYAILFGVAYLYFVQTQNAYGHTFARMARDVLRQQGLILKITFFVAIEMILFPLFCGVVIGLSTLPLFKDATVASRIAFYRFSPNISLVLHWLVGTAFMFNFSYFVGYCRGIVRPGVMWFIRDPNDEAFHPIREILERPALLQLRKLASGAFMYFTLIILGITMTIHSVNLLLKGVLPLRWRVDEPISDLPVELLLFHLVFPLTARWLNPTSRLKILFAAWWRKLAHWLRLSSFMYASEGQRYYDEEGYVVYRSWKAWLLRWRPPIPGRADQNGQTVGSGEELDIDAPVIFVRDGGLLRVPNSDRNFHLKDRRVLVPVNEDGNALDPSEDLPGEIDPLMELPTRRRGGLIDPKENTIIVYAPPHFRYRLMTFIVLLWTSIMAFLVLSVIVPVIVGRAIVKLKTERQVHDVYAALIGVYALRGVWFVVDWTSSKILTITSHGLQPIDFKAQIRVAKDLFHLGAKLLYFGLMFGILMPFTLGLMVELYVVLPLRTSVDDPESGIIFAVIWAVGLLYMKIIHRILSVMTNNRYAADMNRVFNGANVQNWDAMLATRRLILPALGMAALAVGGPFVLAWIAAEGLGEYSAFLDPSLNMSIVIGLV